jgi:transketolase
MSLITSASVRSWFRLGARGTFGAAVLALSDECENLKVLSADLVVSSGLDRLQKKRPEIVINTGIAEQNLIGVAAGLAKEGSVVFATSFAPFVSMRASEQIRMNLGYMQQNVKAVALGSGLAMAHLGNSHYGLEDVSVMRSIPGITVVCPADGAEIFKAVFAAAELDAPMYIRLTGVAPNPVVFSDDYDFEIGKAIFLREGRDVAFVTNGTMLFHCLEAVKLLELDGVSVSVVNMHTVKPLDTAAIDKVLGAKALITVEEHSVVGGLGGAVAEYMAPLRNRPPHLLLGIPDVFGKSGEYLWLLERYGLTADGIAASVKTFLKR